MDSLGLGGYFRDGREAQGLTLEQLAISTKIREFYLKALEEERFNSLPAKVFTRGFVRTYARALELDEDEALRRFSISARSYYQKEEEEQQQVIQREEDDRKGKADRNAVGILSGVILIGLVFILSREQPSSPTSQTNSTSKSISSSPSASIVEPEAIVASSKTKTNGEPDRAIKGGGRTSVSSSSSNTKKTSAPRPVQPVVKPKPVQKSAVSSPVKTVRPMSTPFEPSSGEQDGAITLELEALEITWVVVRSDNRAPHEALLQPGERALWRADESFLLTLGNAGGVKVILNGEPRGPFGEKGKVIRDLEIRP